MARRDPLDPSRRRRPARRALLLLAGALTVASAPAAVLRAADAPSELTLAEAVRRAVATYPAVAAARAQADAAAATAAAARAARRPTADLSATGTQYQKPTIVSPIHALAFDDLPHFDTTIFTGTAALGYTLLDGGARRATVAARAADAAAAAAVAAASAQELAGRTVAAYTRALSARAVLAAQDRRLAALDAERDRVRRLLDAGKAPRVDLYRVDAAVAAGRADRVSTAALLHLALRDLARLTGAGDAEVPAAALVPAAPAPGGPPGRRELLERAAAASPAVARAEHELDAAQAAVELAASERRPKLRAGARWLEFADGAGDLTGEWNAGLQVALPLYRGGAVPRRLAAARAARDAARGRLEQARLETAEAVDRALAALDEAGARRQSLDDAVRAFAEVARVEKLRLGAGAGVESDYLDAEADLLGAEAQRATARDDEVRALGELARATGELGSDWLDTHLVNGE